MSLFNGTNNGEIGLSVRRAAKLLGINKDTAQKAFKRLKEHKFIKMVKQGSYDLKCRHSSEYELTALDCRERAATKDYMSWKGPREQRLKQKPVPPRRTDGPVTSDCSQREKDPKCTHSPNTSDRGTSNSHPHGPTHSDTYSLPSSGVLAHPSVGPAKIESPERLGDTKDELANNWMGGA